jgi:enoyl-CoA hydratase
LADKKRKIVRVVYGEPGIATVIINSPPVNALTSEMLSELECAFDELETNDDVRAIILTAEGKRAFVAGADINALSIRERNHIKMYLTKIHNVFKRIDAFPKPTICAISSHATGSGCELAMVCDIRVANEHAKFIFPECRFGVVSAGGATQRLPRLIPKGRALYYLYTADAMSAQEGLQLGFVDFIRPAEEVYPAALEIARKISNKAALTVSTMKKLVKKGMEKQIAESLKEEIEASIESSGTDDFYEGMTAYLEKREPIFKGH